MAEYEYNHYIPKTYLEAWNDELNKIWVYSDEGLFKHAKPKKQMGINNLYIKNIKDEFALSDNDLEDIFSGLNNYHVYYKEKKLSNYREYLNNYKYFSDWIIKDDSDLLVKKNIIKNGIEQVRILKIEKNWNMYENNWSTLRKIISDSILDEKENIEFENLMELKKFIFAQNYRVSSRVDEYTTIIDLLLGTLRDDIGDIYDEVIDKYARCYFLNNIEAIQEEKLSKGYQTLFNRIMELQVVLFKTYGEKVFFTSDKPVFFVNDNQFYHGRRNALYMPISPRILCGLYKGNLNAYTVKVMADNEVKKFNRMIISLKNRYFISNKELNKN